MFPCNISLSVGQAGDVATRAGKGRNDARRYWIDGGHENYRNRSCDILGNQERRCSGKDNIHLELDQLGCNV